MSNQHESREDARLEQMPARQKAKQAELAALQVEVKSLERELSSVRSHLSAAENQLNVIKSSVTYRAGVLVVNSRSLRGLIRLPWRLYKMYAEFRRSRSIGIGEVSSAPNEGGCAEPSDTRPDFARVWVGLDVADPSTSIPLTLSPEGQSSNASWSVRGSEGTLACYIPLPSTSKLLKSEAEWTVFLKETDQHGESYSAELSCPVSGLRSYHAFIGDGDLALAFAYRFQSETPESVDIRIEQTDLAVNPSVIDTFSEVRWHSFLPGISVVLPTYNGRSTIHRCLESLACQTLPTERFEVIAILNGPDDGTSEVLSDFQKEHADFNLRVIKAAVAGAGNARNLGMEVARREYLTFIDDDDYVSENYLEELLNTSSPDGVAIATVLDVDDGERVSDNVINQQLKNAETYGSCSYKDVSSVLTMNACKSLPTFLAVQLRYDAEMRSGEDVCFFSRYFARYSPSLRLGPVAAGATYYRVLTDNSVSRRPQSFDFNVSERLAVIQAIDACYPFVPDTDKRDFLASKMMAQSNFVRSYLENHRGDISRYAALLQGVGINFGYDKQIAASLADTLVYSYCFAPYLDTAGIVMAKRIQARGVPVDVVCNNMDSVRKVDRRLDLITAGLVGRKIVLNSRPSFASWVEIRRFCDDADKRVKALEKSGAAHREIYSRAMWIASHFAAAVHKLRKPEVVWRAEFSDPLLKDVQGQSREAELELSWLKNIGVFSALKKAGISPPDTRNLFQWGEFLVYAFADEIVFTNENQFSYMLNYSELPKTLLKSVEERSVVEGHPTLPAPFYQIAKPDYKTDNQFLNCAYFGSFYATRGLGEVFEALREVTNEGVGSIRLHVFTNNGDEARIEARNQRVEKHVFINEYVGFYEFLALTNQFDCLLVNDANTKGLKEINPYLPSKLSDYMGSGSIIWALCEEDSVLHQVSVSDDTGRVIASCCGDKDSHVQVLNLLHEKHQR